MCDAPPRVATKYKRPDCNLCSVRNCKHQSGFNFRKSCCPKGENQWIDFPLEVLGLIGGVSPPTLPSNASTRARYYVEDKVLTVQWYFENQSTVIGGSDGVDILYALNLPSGFSYDNVDYLAGSFELNVGANESYNGYSTLLEQIVDGNSFYVLEVRDFLFGIDTGTPARSTFSSTDQPLTTPQLRIRATAKFKIF